MITRFEQLIGVLTLVLLGLSILVSHLVEASTTYYIETNFGISQYAQGLICIGFAFPIVMRPSRSSYAAYLFPYTVYFIANARYVYVAHLASTVPSLLLCLWVALYWFVLTDFARYINRRYLNGKQHTYTTA